MTYTSDIRETEIESTIRELKVKEPLSTTEKNIVGPVILGFGSTDADVERFFSPLPLLLGLFSLHPLSIHACG